MENRLAELLIREILELEITNKKNKVEKQYLIGLYIDSVIILFFFHLEEVY